MYKIAFFPIFVPIVLPGAVSELPTLVSLVDGAVLDTLIPHFVFDIGTLPENTGGVLDFSTNPDPNRTGWEVEFTLQSGEHLDKVAYYNLEPNTTYYWRVGVLENFDYNQPPKWTQQWSFTTGPAGGVILPAPNLLAPSSDSTISTDRVVLEWAAVPGAEEYVLILYDFDQDKVSFFIIKIA